VPETDLDRLKRYLRKPGKPTRKIFEFLSLALLIQRWCGCQSTEDLDLFGSSSCGNFEGLGFGLSKISFLCLMTLTVI
jgi:hypothetical protein